MYFNSFIASRDCVSFLLKSLLEFRVIHKNDKINGGNLNLSDRQYMYAKKTFITLLHRAEQLIKFCHQVFVVF